jgi:hypothetical protein
MARSIKVDRQHLVCMVVPEGQVFRADFSQSFGVARCFLAGSRVSCRSGIGSWVTQALTFCLASVNSIWSEDCHDFGLRKSWCVHV